MLSLKKYYRVFAVVLLLCFATRLEAQKDNKKRANTEVISLSDSLTAYSQSDLFAFPYINSKRFHYDPGALQRIKRLNDSGRDDFLYAALREYVRRFGIENFRKNTPMLWRLAQLSETYGPPGEAILLYKLILKHHQQGIDIKRLLHVYDSIETDKKELYVPLDYYYKLVALRKEIDTLRPPRGVLLNMGDAINSSREDYGPTIGNVDSLLLFTSKRNIHDVAGQRIVDEDIFFSQYADGYWHEAKELNAINTSYNEGSACLSPDGEVLFFARCNAADALGNCDLYRSVRNEYGQWSASKNLGKAINSPGWDSHPSLSLNGDTLFFASNRIGGFGLSDIYFSVKGTNGQWQKAQNVGPIVNTRNSEVSPFFHHKFNVLYFGSNGHPLNFGGFDIYKSYLRANRWDEPKNIGPLVNGAGSEYYFTIDSESTLLYYAKSKKEDPKNLDLYSFPVPMGSQPQATARLEGSFRNKYDDKPMEGIVSVIDLDYGVEVAPKFLRPDGSFNFELINNRRYLLIIQGDKFFRFEEVFFMSGDTQITRYAEPIENRVAFESLEFENGRADILESMHSDLRKVASFLTDHPGIKLIIHGHTDSTGEEKANLLLSQERASAIKAFLITQFKINDNRIRSIGYGSSQPLVDEVSEKARRLNRRVEFEMYRDR